MGGTKAQGTPTKFVKTTAKKRSRTSQAFRQSPSRTSKPSTNENPQIPTTPVRQRRRASDFASKKKSSSKKRQRNHATGGKASSKHLSQENEDYTKEDEASVDEVLKQVHELMNSNSTSAKAKALADALKRANEAFENDISGSSSSGEEPADEIGETSDDAEKLMDETPVSQTAKERAKRSESTPRKPKDSSNESQPDGRNAESRKVSLKGEDSSDEEVDPVRHKAEIEALKRDDPMFYKFLEENDGSLLEFDMSEDSEQEKESGADRKRQQQGGNADGGDSENDDIRQDQKHSHVLSEKDLWRESSMKDPNTASGSDREDIDKEGDVNISGSEVSMSDESDGDDTDTMTQSEPARRDTDNVGAMDDARVSDESSGAADDVAGYSGDDDDDDMGAEAEAAAEAGLEAQDGSDSDPAVASDGAAKRQKRGSRKLIFVDMQYLRQLKELLKSKRSSLKACKDLLRLFRAGRDVLPSSPVSQDKKAKQAMSGKKSKKSSVRKEGSELELEDDDLDIYTDDGSFTSGRVRFASSKSYQQAMNLAIIGIQDALDKMLGKPERKLDTIEPLEVTWDPTDSSRWMNLEQIFRPYVFHLLALCDATEDADTLRFLLRRLEKLVPYTRENKVLLKKITRVALHVWSSDPHHIGQTTRLRSYVLLTRLAHGPGNAETVLRACCNAYASKVASVCNSKKLPLIHFATSCLVELFGIDMGASYTTAFSYLREMAVSLRAVLIAKDRKQEVERIHNWSYINKLRLLSKVLGRYGSEYELRPLIYPYVQISIGIMRAHPTPRTIPLRFHVASYLSDLTADTGVFIPVIPQLLSLLRCSELRKKPARGTTSGLDWRSLLRVSDETVKTKPFLTGLVNGVVYHIAKFFAIISKHVSFPEVAHFAEVTLKKTAKGLPVAQWRLNLTCLAEKIHETGNMIADARSKADLSPHGAIHPDGMLAIVPGMDKERKMPVKRFFEVEHARVVKEERLRDEKQSEKRSRCENGRDEEVEKEEDESSDSEQARPSKKRKKLKGEKQKKRVGLSVPKTNDSDDEGDEIAELSLNSDEDEEDD